MNSLVWSAYAQILLRLLNCLYLDTGVFSVLPFRFSTQPTGAEWASGCAGLSCLQGLNEDTYPTQNTFSNLFPLFCSCLGKSKTTWVFTFQLHSKTTLRLFDLMLLHSNWQALGASVQPWRVLQRSWLQDIRQNLDNQSSFYYTFYGVIVHKTKGKASFTTGCQTPLSQCSAATCVSPDFGLMIYSKC